MTNTTCIWVITILCK